MLEVIPLYNISRMWMLFTTHAQPGYYAVPQITVPEVKMAHLPNKTLLTIEGASHYILVLTQNQFTSARNHSMDCLAAG